MTWPDAARVETSLPAANVGASRSAGELAGLEPVEEGLPLRVRRGPRVEVLLPGGARLGGAILQLAGVRDHVVGDDEALLRIEAEHLLRRGQLVGAERGPVDLAGVLLAGARPADDRLQDDHRRLRRLALRGLDRRVQLGHVFDVLAGLLPVDGLHLPAVRLVALGDVFGERDVRVVFDRDLVRVVDRDEVAELLVAGEAGCLGGDALLQVAVTGDHVDEVVERARAGSGLGVEQPALVARRVREADGGGEALTQRAGRDLDALRVAVLGVPRSERAPRAEGLEVAELETEAAEVQLHVLGERRVPRREDEPVTAQPVGIGRVVTQHALIQQVRRRRQAHRRAGVAVADLLHGIGGQHAGGVHRAPIDVFPVQDGVQLGHAVAFLQERPRRSVASKRRGRGSANRARVCASSISKRYAVGAMHDADRQRLDAWGMVGGCPRRPSAVRGHDVD